MPNLTTNIVPYTDRKCPICGSNFLIRCDPAEYVYWVPNIKKPDGTWTRYPARKADTMHRYYLCRYNCWRKATAMYEEHKAEMRTETIKRITEVRRARERRRKDAANLQSHTGQPDEGDKAAHDP